MDKSTFRISELVSLLEELLGTGVIWINSSVGGFRVLTNLVGLPGFIKHHWY